MNPAYSALKWSFLGEIASKAVTPLVFVILARLLTPEDFGVVIAATIVISFSQIFWEAGMGKALIQFQGDSVKAANVAFWINNALGVMVAGILIISSSVIAESVFHDVRVAPVLQVMAFQVVLSASVSVHIALLQKDMNFQHLFWVRFVTVVIPGVASIPLAWYGMGYWALVAGTLTGQAFQVAIFWRTSSWRPQLSFSLTIARQLIKFGRWVVATAALGWFYIWADSFVVGIYFGPKELGLYRTGNAFMMMIFGMCFGPLMPVLYSYLATVSQDRTRIRETMAQVIKMLTFLSIPIAAIVSVNAEFISDIVFGPKWQGISLVLIAMALVHGFSSIVGANGEAYRAVGLPSSETKIMAVSLIFYVIGYSISVQYGFEIFIWTRLALAISTIFVHFLVMRAVLNIDIGPTFSYMLTVSLICVLSIVLVTQFNFFTLAHDQLYRATLSTILIITALVFYERRGVVPMLYGITKKIVGR